MFSAIALAHLSCSTQIKLIETIKQIIPPSADSPAILDCPVLCNANRINLQLTDFCGYKFIAVSNTFPATKCFQQIWGGAVALRFRMSPRGTIHNYAIFIGCRIGRPRQRPIQITGRSSNAALGRLHELRDFYRSLPWSSDSIANKNDAIMDCPQQDHPKS